MSKICAGIVLFNPSISRLKSNISAISCQVEKVFLQDNGSANVDEVKKSSKNILMLFL